MALNVRDAESSYLVARSTVEAWQTDFIRQWYGPEIDLAIIQFWDQMDPLMKNYLAQTQPQAVAQVEAQVKAAKERYNNGTSI